MKRYKGLSVLVTGGAGFVGSHLVENLLELEAYVSVVDTMLYGNKIKFKHKNLSVYKVDVTDISRLSPLFEGQHIVFHLAAVVGVEETQLSPVSLLNTEVIGTSNVIKLSAENNISRLIFASSSEVYGDCEKPMVENGLLNPKSTYALTKLIGEHFCNAYCQEYGLDYTSLRYFNIYGDRQDERFVLPRFIKDALNGKGIRIYGNGKQTRDFTYIDDSINMTLLAGIKKECRNQIINVGTGHSISINMLANMVINELNKGTRLLQVDYDTIRPLNVEVFNRVADTRKARDLIGYKDLMPVEVGLSKYLKKVG